MSTLTWPSEDERRALRLRVADHIEQHPELHDQAQWGDDSDNPACGTACCVAGWACRLGGGARGLPVPVAALHLRTCEIPGYVLRSHIANDWVEKYTRFAWMADALLGAPPEPVEIAS